MSRSRGRGAGPTRRDVLAASLAALAPLAACTRDDAPRYDGGWVGAERRARPPAAQRLAGDEVRPPARGRARRAASARSSSAPASPASARRARCVRAGVDDCHVLELEDSAGGNSRGHAMAGMRCPLGAHYLPVPGASATEVIELLDELGVRRSVAGRAVYDERMLCHSPQERLFIDGGWRDGLLPPIEALPAAERATTLAEYRAFGAAVAAAGDDGAFAIPTARSRWSDSLARPRPHHLRRLARRARPRRAGACAGTSTTAAATTTAPAARDVSAWAGLHYFASRHGFRAPGDEARGADGNEGILDLARGQRLARRTARRAAGRAPARGPRRPRRRRRSRTRSPSTPGTRRRGQRERWIARPRRPRDAALRRGALARRAAGGAAARRPRLVRHAPWLVANLQLDTALDDRPGARAVVGQRRLRRARPRLRRRDAPEHAAVRRRRPCSPPTSRSAPAATRRAPSSAVACSATTGEPGPRVIADIAPAHPDLAAKLRRVDLMRYGHAMSIPAPGVRSSAALRALAAPQRRVHFAHADLSAYSVFEEAFFHGTRAGRAAAARAVAVTAPLRRNGHDASPHRPRSPAPSPSPRSPPGRRASGIRRIGSTG